MKTYIYAVLSKIVLPPDYLQAFVSVLQVSKVLRKTISRISEEEKKMKFEDYFATPSLDKIIRQLAQSDLCPNIELLDGGCSLYASCNECWEQAIINSDLAEYEKRKPTPFYVVEHEGQHNKKF